MTVRAALICTLIALSACSGKAPESADNKAAITDTNEAKADAAIENIVQVSGPNALPPGVPVSKPSPTARDPNALPPQFQGRWGLRASDCDYSVRAPEGLLVIQPKALKFYRFAAKIDSLQKQSDYAVTAHLTWGPDDHQQNGVQKLSLATGGIILLRTEQSPAKTYRYQRC
jgi:hypothetical protein